MYNTLIMIHKSNQVKYKKIKAKIEEKQNMSCTNVMTVYSRAKRECFTFTARCCQIFKAQDHSHHLPSSQRSFFTSSLPASPVMARAVAQHNREEERQESRANTGSSRETTTGDVLKSPIDGNPPIDSSTLSHSNRW